MHAPLERSVQGGVFNEHQPCDVDPGFKEQRVRASLPVLAARPEAPSNCRSGGGCGKDKASSAEGLAADVEARVRNHPCYSEEAHHHFARMHVAVAPACNIQCHYCNRKYDCASESRPGVVSERLTPEDAVRKVLAVAKAVPQLAVVGIAGPGDPLANASQTFETLEGVARVAPDLQLCLSTNGLALPDHVDRIVALGVGHVTITINMVDPEIGDLIYPWVIWGGRKVRGLEASRILHERQMLGLERLVEKKVLVKVNSVVIPGVNDEHLAEVSRVVKAKGAFVHNVMPLISAPEFGTHYGLTGQRGPTSLELERVQEVCEGATKVMRHCRQCRADAVGMLGQDRGQEFTLARLSPEPVEDASAARAAHREGVERRREQLEEKQAAAVARAVDVPAGLLARVAVATKGDGLINAHFGHVREFLIYDVSREGVRLITHRKIEQYCQGGDGEEERLMTVIRTLEDCSAVFVAKIGRCPREDLAKANIDAVEAHAFLPIQPAILEWFEEWAKNKLTAAKDAA